ncbi:MAG: phenylacetate--CoA ligase family protein [Firmicutes bacterium]|nr:phenylacetate--CoA ligase family protein [Bacillota bacterium]
MTIYNNSPIFIQNILTTLKGEMNLKERYGAFYKKAIEEYKNIRFSSLKQAQDYQNKKVSEFVKFAFENSPFYKEFYSNVNIDSIKTVDDLSKLPILEKETVRHNIEKMYTVTESVGIVSNTSGTTGKSMRFIYTKEDMQRRMAYLDVFKEMHGFVNLKMKKASFNSSKIVPDGQKKNVFWRDNLASNQRIYSGYHCKDNNVKYYVENLNKYKPDSLDGYPSALYEVAKYINQNGIRLTFKPKAIFPTAETLLPHYRTEIEKAFDCPVRDQYASSEGAPFITECECGKLHYCLDTGVIEQDENGDMLVTCFETHGTPLIRYRVGDRIVFSKDEDCCECGSVFPLVERIDGRTLDFIETKSRGRFTSVYLSLVSGDFLNSVKSMQFVQNSADTIDIYVCADSSYIDERMNKIIMDKLHYSMGDDMNFVIHRVNGIPKDPSGKYRLIINNYSK